MNDKELSREIDTSFERVSIQVVGAFISSFSKPLDLKAGVLGQLDTCEEIAGSVLRD